MEEPAAKQSDYGVIVVGSGPAGTSAAINVVNRKRRVAVMGGQSPFGRLRKARAITNHPGFTSVSGEELEAASVRHLDGFVVFSERESSYAGAVVLAMGVDREAEIEGAEELVGQGHVAAVEAVRFLRERAKASTGDAA